MKKLLIALCLVISQLAFSQFTIIEEFDPGTTWTFTNGAGIQNYGPPENYGTTSIGTTPYPNSATIDITSPVYDISSCTVNPTISFPLSGIIENGWDFLYFQYRIGAGAWITVQTFTGTQGATFTYTTIPNTATQFRFRCITDGSVNTYGPWWATSVYYYDITRFTIDCPTVLPIELVEWSGNNIDGVNRLSWVTVSEINNDYYMIERSIDGINWDNIGTRDGAGNSSTGLIYDFDDRNYSDTINYYRLTQVDFDGQYETFNIISIDNTIELKTLLKRYNLMGQELTNETYMYYKGIVLERYNDGTTLKFLKHSDF